MYYIAKEFRPGAVVWGTEGVMEDRVTSRIQGSDGIKLFGAQKMWGLSQKEIVIMSSDDDRRIAELFATLTPENQDRAIEISAALLAAQLASSFRQETAD